MTKELIENFKDNDDDLKGSQDNNSVVNIVTISLTVLTFFLWAFFGNRLPLLRPYTGLTMFTLAILNIVGIAFQPLGIISSICTITLLVTLISVKVLRGKKLQAYSLRSYKSFSA
jgi:hypothetical protein